jgi:hypothetical protein
MTSEDMDRRATLAMTVLFHNSGRRPGFMQVSQVRFNPLFILSKMVSAVNTGLVLATLTNQAIAAG